MTEPPYANHDLWLRVAESEKTTQPITTPAPVFSASNDSLIAGTKAALWLNMLRDSVGDKAFGQNMLTYFSTWKFSHPHRRILEVIMGYDVRKKYPACF